MIRLLVTAAVALGVVVLLLWAMQRRIIYLPVRQVSPAPMGVEEASVQTEDGLVLPAWVLTPGGERVGTVLVFNGNAGNRSHRMPLAESLTAAGFEVVLFDYRGYGEAPGSPSQEGLEADARAMRRFLDSRHPGPVVYFGESLGAAVATRLAAERPPDALVLRSPFPSLVEVARVHYRFLPVGLMIWDRWELADPLALIDTPVLVIAGEDDSIVPFRLSRAVYDAVGGYKEMLVMEGADHNDYELAAGAGLGEAVRRFLDEVIRQGW